LYNKYPDNSILSIIKSISKNGYASSSVAGTSLLRISCKRFGSWKKACVKAGVKSPRDKPVYDQCYVEGCDLKPRSPHGKWCETHYYRNRRNGDPNKLFNCQYSLNENLYSCEWNDSNAWLLGILWSDGYIRNNSIGVKSKDIQLIKCVKSVLETDVDIKKCYVNKKEYYSIGVASKKISTDLRDMGMYENKSLTISYPNSLSVNYFWSFWRGLIDGDGCACVYKPKGRKYETMNLSLVSASEKLKKSLSFILNKFGIRHSIYMRGKYKKDGKINKYWRGNNTWTISIISYKSLKKLYNMMYPSFDVPCLHRKRDKFYKWIMSERPKIGRPKLNIIK